MMASCHSLPDLVTLTDQEVHYPVLKLLYDATGPHLHQICMAYGIQINPSVDRSGPCKGLEFYSRFCNMSHDNVRSQQDASRAVILGVGWGSRW